MVDGKGYPFPGEYRQATRLAVSLILDDMLTCAIEGTTDASSALDLLPQGVRLRIERDLRRWVVAYTMAAANLAEDPPRPPACVAEALAMHGVLSFAADILTDGPEFGLPSRVPCERAKDYLSELEDVLFEDQDFLFLHDGRADGIGADPEEPLGLLLGTVNLAYADWFRALPGHVTHPYFDEAPACGGGEDEADEFPFF